MQSPGAKNALWERRGVAMRAAKKRRRPEQKLAAPKRRRLARILREAHARLELWRLCDHKICQRRETCGRAIDPCGARVAPQGWAWLHHVLKAMREGKSQAAAVEAADFAALGYRERVTIAWKGGVWKPIEFCMRNDGTMIRADLAPARPDIDPQFMQFVKSPWLHDALSAGAKA
jgi:hypothetical protein